MFVYHSFQYGSKGSINCFFLFPVPEMVWSKTLIKRLQVTMHVVVSLEWSPNYSLFCFANLSGSHTHVGKYGDQNSIRFAPWKNEMLHTWRLPIKYHNLSDIAELRWVNSTLFWKDGWRREEKNELGDMS